MVNWTRASRRRRRLGDERREVAARAARAAADDRRVDAVAFLGANAARALMQGDELSPVAWRAYVAAVCDRGDPSVDRDTTLRRMLTELADDPGQIRTAADTIAFANRWQELTDHPSAAWAFVGGMRHRATHFDDEARPGIAVALSEMSSTAAWHAPSR